jgi:hypothetical protein
MHIPQQSPDEEQRAEGSHIEDTHQLAGEEIRQGLIYPPPPSFYQNMQIASGQFPPLPVVPALITPPPHEQYPPIMVQSSRKWIWILVTLLSSTLLLSCGLCSWALYAVVSPTVQDLNRNEELVNNYYEAIRDKNYDLAYQYLAPQGTIKGLTKAQFIQQAQGRDQQYGHVLSFVPSQPTFESSTGLNLARLSITVQVSRPKLKYNVLLSLQKTGDTWKIVTFDSI